MNQTPIRKITDEIANSIRDQAVFNINEGMEAIRPHYTLDVEKAYDQRLRRMVNRCARRTIDKRGNRIAFVLPDRGIIVNIDRCDDPELIAAVTDQMKKQLKGFNKSYRRVKKRLKKLNGQITFDDLLTKAE